MLLTARALRQLSFTGLLLCGTLLINPLAAQQNPALEKELTEMSQWANQNSGKVAEAREKTQLVWAKMSHSERLNQTYFYQLGDFEWRTNSAIYELSNERLQYTFAHQADYEKAWGQEEVYRYQRQMLRLISETCRIRWNQPDQISKEEQQKRAAKLAFHLGQKAPQHLDYLVRYIDYEMFYNLFEQPDAYLKAADAYLMGYETNPILLIAAVQNVLDTRIAAQWKLAALKWVDKALSAAPNCRYELVKMELYTLLKDDAKVKTQAEICRKCASNDPNLASDIENVLYLYELNK